jgi:glycosyltransferase involved in cell wall biosynthesis
MKVLHCLNSPNIGGLERLVIELAIAQQQKGVHISIMLDTRKGLYYDYLKSHKIPILDSGIKGGFDFNPTIYKLLKQKFKTFDIVHLHSFSPIRSLALKHSGVKAVYTMHGLSKNIRKENIFKYKLRESLKKYFLNKVDVLIANSQHTLRLTKKHYGLVEIESKTILNGVKLLGGNKVFNNEKSLTIGLVSRFTKRKRIDRLINGFSLFLNRGGDGRLILVGDGAAFSNVEKQVKDLELTHKIELVGYSNKVEDYYSKFDLCVHPSDNEGFGLVAVEAYNFGIPVIAFSDSGGLVEVVKPLEPDNVVENEKQLADRLLFYFNNRDQVLDNSVKRMAYAQEQFSIERMEREYYKVYQNLI